MRPTFSFGSSGRLQHALALCTLLLMSCSKDSSQAAGDHLFDATRRDLGAVRVESDYSAAYRLTNSTSLPLKVVGIKTSCGCVAANYDTGEIPPGDSRDIVLKLSTHGQTALGPLVKHAAVELATGEKIYLTLAARLESEFEVEPRRLEFSADERTRRLTVIRKQLDADAFSRLLLTAEPESYEVVEQPSNDANQRIFQITLREASAGSSLPEISLTMTPGGRPLSFSTVICTRSGPTLRPSAFVVVMTDSTSNPPAQRFELIDFQSQPMRVVSVEPADGPSKDLLEVTFDPAQDPKSFSIGLAHKPAAPATQLHVSVQFESLDRTSTGRLLLPCHILSPQGHASSSETRSR
jgi:hypothetical protein